MEVLPLILILLLVLLSRHRLNSFQDDGIYVMLPCSHHHTVDPGCAAHSESVTVDSESVTVSVPCVSRVCPGFPPVSSYRVCPGSPGVFEPVFLRCASAVRKKEKGSRDRSRVHEARHEQEGASIGPEGHCHCH